MEGIVNQMEEAWKEVWQEVGLPSVDDIIKHNAESYEALRAFIAQVDWTEPLLIGLGVFYLLSIIAIFLTRKNFAAQFAIWASFRVYPSQIDYLNFSATLSLFLSR